MEGDKDLHIITEVGVFGDLDIDDPTKNKIKKKTEDRGIDETIAEAIQENARNLIK